MGKKYILEIVENKDGTFAWSNFAPYTEPDLEQVKKEAYEQGAEDMRKALRLLIDCDDNCLTIPDVFHSFGEGSYHAVVRKHPAMEIIDRIRQYEQKKQFCVGDEFETESGKRFVILKMDGTEIDRYIDEEGQTYCMITKYEVMRKTGRHFPEIVEVLEKMRGEQDG